MASFVTGLHRRCWPLGLGERGSAPLGSCARSPAGGTAASRTGTGGGARTWTLLTALAVSGLCAGQESAPEARTPPASSTPSDPETQAIAVSLGSSGSTVTLIPGPAGGYTLDGVPVEPGHEVTSDNGASYVLRRADGEWSAASVGPEPEAVPLGESGSVAYVTTAEDGTYWIGDREVKDGATVQGLDGAVYILTRNEDGAWAAVLVVAEIDVTLGLTGERVTIEVGSDGTASMGGSIVSDRTVVRAGGGNEYVLSLAADGSWTATYRRVASVVSLGRRGGTVRLVREEDGTYSMRRNPFESGTAVVGRGGREYVLTLQADATWTATYLPEEQRVPAGSSGSLILTKAENGVWMWNDEVVSDGDTVTVENGSNRLFQ